MMRVSEEMRYIYPELAAEFTTVVMQVRAGQERGKSFNQFVRRTGIEDIKSLSAMIVQSEKFGTSLGQALKVYADALRTRRRLRVEAEVGKAGIKMLFPIVVFILPVLFVITLVPGMLSVFKNLQLLAAEGNAGLLACKGEQRSPVKGTVENLYLRPGSATDPKAGQEACVTPARHARQRDAAVCSLSSAACRCSFCASVSSFRQLSIVAADSQRIRISLIPRTCDE